jgi:serine/threonine protein phosphatase PrpC
MVMATSAAAASSSSSSTDDDDPEPCPFYGCPLYPADIHYNTDSIRDVLQQMRELKAVEVEEKGLLLGNHKHASYSTVAAGPDESSGRTNPPPPTAALNNAVDDPHYSNRILRQWNRRDAACLTLIGYKGGLLQQQINQDRAFVVSPYLVDVESDASAAAAAAAAAADPLQWADENNEQHHRILLGVFDGHAPRGELVSEFTVRELPIRLAQRLKNTLPPLLPNTNTNNNNNKNSLVNVDQEIRRQRTIATIAALNDTFVELDRLVPADPSGGCTASVILRQDNQIFVANAGDSQSFVVTFRPSTNVTHVVYVSREDKPSLPDEKLRVERMGGQVYIPTNRGTSRVVYQDPRTGSPTGLAMSRSIGDWAAGKLGVIPDPIVQVLDINELVAAELNGAFNGKSKGSATDTAQMCYMVDAMGEVSADADCRSISSSTGTTVPSDGVDAVEDDDVHIFAVSATDGMMDYLSAAEIGKALSKPLFDHTSTTLSGERSSAFGASHPVTACELLIFRAVNGWQVDKQGRYRDDIAIAVSAMRIPPPSSSSSKAGSGSTRRTTSAPPAQ